MGSFKNRFLNISFSNIFKDKSGRIVIAQKPNAPLLIAIAFYLLGFIPQETLQTISYWGVFITMLYWAYLEMTQGVNTWRKLLGIIVALYFLSKVLF